MANKKNAPGETTFPPIDKFPARMHRDIKARAAQKGISIKSFVVQALRYALDNEDVVEGKELVDSNDEDG